MQNNLQQQMQDQMKQGQVADAFYTHQLMQYVGGNVGIQGVRDAAVRRIPKPEYNTAFDAFLAQSNTQQSRSPINIKGVSTVAAPRDLNQSVGVINDNSQSNIM